MSLASVQSAIKSLRIKRVHSSELNVTSLYNTESLECNPFVKSLLETRANGPTNRFPVGNMVKLTAEYVNTSRDSKDSKALLMVIPIINNYISLQKYSYTSSYILNNRRYIDSVLRDGSFRRFYPRKLLYKSNIDTIEGFLPGTTEVIARFYQNFIKEMLAGIKKSEATSQTSAILLVNSGESISFRGTTPVINIKSLLPDFAIDDTLITWKDHPVLCHLIFQYLDYLS